MGDVWRQRIYPLAGHLRDFGMSLGRGLRHDLNYSYLFIYLFIYFILLLFQATVEVVISLFPGWH